MEVKTEISRTNAIIKLYDAALKGNVQSLNNLLREDPFMLERCIIQRGCYTQSPLHVASKMGQLDFVKTILKSNSSLCFVHDEDGMTPIHVAAIHGQVDVLKTFLDEKPQAIRECTKSGDTVLHLCVKHNQMDALKLLLDCKHEVRLELLNSKDSDGNTLLHLAVISKQVEMITELLKHKGILIEINAMNNKGLTAMDCHLLLRRKTRKLCGWHEITDKWPEGDNIGPTLQEAKALTAKDAQKIQKSEKRVRDQSNALMVAASVIAGMAFQITISPPGGFWQEDSISASASAPSTIDSLLEHREAGKYVQERLNGWHLLVVSNTIALASSLSVILLLIGGLPYGRLFVGVLRITMWIAVSATAMTYFISVEISATNRYEQTTFWAPIYTFIAWTCLMVVLILAHAVKFLVKLIIRLPTLRLCFSKYLCCACYTNDADKQV